MNKAIRTDGAPAAIGPYSQFFTEPFPARAAYQAAALPQGAKVEIEAVAVR